MQEGLAQALLSLPRVEHNPGTGRAAHANGAVDQVHVSNEDTDSFVQEVLGNEASSTSDLSAAIPKNTGGGVLLLEFK